jgi:hypothetical protein
MYIVARTDGDPSALTAPLRAMVARIDPELPLYDVRLMDQRLAGTLETARFNTLLLSLLGGVGLLLAASGIYGVIAYFVSQRTQEIGVRIALGASTASVVRLILAQAMRPVALGTAIGVVAALAAQPRAREPAVQRQPHRPGDDRRGRRRVGRRRAGRKRRARAARGRCRSDARPAIGVARGRSGAAMLVPIGHAR